MPDDCIFCSVGKGPSDNFLFNDDRCFAVLDKYPSDYGHALVISKRHYENMLVASDEDTAHMFSVAKKIASNSVKKLNAQGVNIATNTGKEAGQIIEHFHIHIIPRYSGGPKISQHIEMSDEVKKELVAKLKL